MTKFWFISLLAIISMIITQSYKLNHPNLHLLNEEKCGRAYAAKPRIIGGWQITIKQFPWMVRLGEQVPFSPHSILFFCGGTLITPSYVLTAAHCVNKKQVNIVRLGNDSPDQQDISVSKVKMHERYTTKNNDIALLRLSNSARLSRHVWTICLPFDPLLPKNYEYKKAQIAGWGLISNKISSHIPDKLFTVEVPIIPLKYCIRMFRHIINVDNSNVCIGGNDEKDSCSGDSGGPLMLKMSTNNSMLRYYVIGVVSGGSYYCGKGMPSLFARTSSFLNWILDNIET